MSTLAEHQTTQLLEQALLTRELSRSPSPSPPPSPETSLQSASRIERLQSLLIKFKTPISPKLIQETLDVLREEQEDLRLLDSELESRTIQNAALGVVAASLYGQVLRVLLEQATEAEAEANWWAETERSRTGLFWYMLQTFPLRMSRAIYTVVYTLRLRNLAITPHAFTPRSLRNLFPSTNSRPSKLAISFFPHLSLQPRMIFGSPFELVRQECHSRRLALEHIRNDRAERLGLLVISKPTRLSTVSDFRELSATLKRIAGSAEIYSNNNDSIITSFTCLTVEDIPKMSSAHAIGFSGFRRPSQLVRLWPRLVIIPPMAIIVFRLIYGSRESFREYITRITSTIQSFWENYLIQPLRDILDTVRTGGEEGLHLISPEGVKADSESLERMALDLSKEKFNFSEQELTDLTYRIRQGDLTPVLKVYEEDMKTPVRSAIMGTLVRSLLIQVQKMKVDVAVALSGIDKLLRSQELTFGFVGVAPALAIAYAAFSWSRNIWQAGQGRGKYGGRSKRQLIWSCLRRIERLLILSSKSRSPQESSKDSLTALDQGLILISVAQLRSYGETSLPPYSRLKEEFLLDVSDLEDTALGRTEKMAVVHRMWRSWCDIFKSVASK